MGIAAIFFQKWHKAIPVDIAHYLLVLSCYVALNPLRDEGMISRLEDWQLSLLG
jgi:hypothetical protein